jgi:L-threonylcarbamoyladenylate synthase
VFEELGQFLSDEDLILDGGNSSIGIESTIIDCTGDQPTILRNGAVTKADIEIELGIIELESKKNSNVKFSGSFEKHYAPKCKVIIDGKEIAGAGFLALSDVETPSGMVRLASPKTTEDFARILYSTFRAADQSGLVSMVVSEPKGEGLSVAIRERLIKAAHGG